MKSRLGPVILDLSGVELDEVEREILLHPQVGGLILFARNYESSEQLSDLVASIRRLRSGLLIGVDQEGGRVQRFKEEFSILPAIQKIGDFYREDSAQALDAATQLGWLMAAELGAHDIDISFAPVLDLDKNGSLVIGDRSFCNDPAVACQLAECYVSGMAEAGMKATGKHFPGHGGVSQDSHLELPIDERSLEQLQAHDLIPYQHLLRQLGAVMPAHIVFPQVDSQPVGFSSIWLKDILQKKMGFDGVIFSDDLSMEGAAQIGAYDLRAQAALEAGCTSILVCNQRAEAEKVVEFLELRKVLHKDSRLQQLSHACSIKSIQQLRDGPRWADAQSVLARFT